MFSAVQFGSIEIHPNKLVIFNDNNHQQVKVTGAKADRPSVVQSITLKASEPIKTQLTHIFEAPRSETEKLVQALTTDILALYANATETDDDLTPGVAKTLQQSLDNYGNDIEILPGAQRILVLPKTGRIDTQA